MDDDFFRKAMRILPSGGKALKITDRLSFGELNALLGFLNRHYNIAELDIKIEATKETNALLRAYFKSQAAESLKSLKLDFDLHEYAFLSILSVAAIAGVMRFIEEMTPKKMHDQIPFQLVIVMLALSMPVMASSLYAVYSYKHNMKSNLEGYIQKNMNLTYNWSDTECKKLSLSSGESFTDYLMRLRDVADRDSPQR